MVRNASYHYRRGELIAELCWRQPCQPGAEPKPKQGELEVAHRRVHGAVVVIVVVGGGRGLTVGGGN